MVSTSLINKVFRGACVAMAFVATAGSALAADYPDFTINENSVPGTDPYGNAALTADRLNGLYIETFTPIFDTGSTTTGTFSTIARFNISAYYNNDVLVNGALGCGLTINGALPCYDLYADFTSTGMFGIDSFGRITFTGQTAGFQLFLDPDQMLGSDILLATSNTLVVGSGSIDPSLANGNFEIVFGNFILSGPGSSFFVAPRPFYITVDVNGNFTEDPLAGGAVSGSANAFFTAVPEPGSLALAGVGLLGAALASSRRRRKI